MRRHSVSRLGFLFVWTLIMLAAFQHHRELHRQEAQRVKVVAEKKAADIAAQEQAKKEAAKKEEAAKQESSAKKEAARKEADELRLQALELLKKLPPELGPARMKRLQDAIALLERAKKIIDPSVNDEADGLRVMILADLASTSMRGVIAEDGINRFLQAVETVHEASRKLIAAEDEFKKARLLAPSNEDDAKDAMDKAAEALALAKHDLGVIRGYGFAGARNFRVTLERIKESSDKRLGPKSGFIKPVFIMYEQLLKADVAARQHELDLFVERLTDPAKVKSDSQLSKGAGILHRGLLKTELEGKKDELLTVQKEIAELDKVEE